MTNVNTGALVAVEIIVEMEGPAHWTKEQCEDKLRELGHNIISYDEVSRKFKVLQRVEKVER